MVLVTRRHPRYGHTLPHWPYLGRCRYCGRPLTDPESARSGVGPDCFSRHLAWLRRQESVGPPAIIRSAQALPLPRRRSARKTPKPKPRPASGLERYVRSGLLRASVVGASCAAFPAACPAIMEGATVKDGYDATERVLSAAFGPGGLGAAGKVAAGHVWQFLVAQAASGAAKPAVGVVSRALSQVLPSSSEVPAG
jgi:hypothetical protein